LRRFFGRRDSDGLNRRRCVGCKSRGDGLPLQLDPAAVIDMAPVSRSAIPEN